MKDLGIPWRSSGQNTTFFTAQGMGSILVRELRSHKLGNAAKKKKIEKDRGSRNKEVILGQKANRLLRAYFSLAGGRGQYQADYLTSIGQAIPD